MDFSKADLHAFINKDLEEDINRLLHENPHAFDVVFNIRRGDFYKKEYKYLYGFDQLTYLKQVVSSRSIPLDATIAIISDDIDWCKENLSFLTDVFVKVTFLDTTPIEAFIECIKAHQLVITNSTFSYWAAYLNTYFSPEHIIYAPSYSTKKIKKGKQISALDHWRIIPVTPYTSILFEMKCACKRVYGRVKSTMKGILK